jgi:WD40 repeat protein
MPVFICYRQVDGLVAARRLQELVDKRTVTGPKGEPIQLDVYLDQTMPAVADWRKIHRPYLEKARALIVICTPGSKLIEGPDDWVQTEINWWLAHRGTAPILIDPLGQGIRYVPTAIRDRWPEIQRVRLVEAEWNGLPPAELEQKGNALQRQIIGNILPSGAAIYEEELKAERRRANNLKRALALVVALLVVAGMAGGYAWTEQVEAQANFRDGQKTESYFRAEQAKQAGADAVTAALLALEGLPDSTSMDTQRTRPFVNEAWHALYAARLRQRERVVLSGHTGSVTSAMFSHDGGRILTASHDHTARLWDSDGKPLATLQGHTNWVTSAVFSPDGGRILTASRDNTARLWDRDGKPLATLQGHTNWVNSAVFSPDGVRILTASNDNTARLWDRDGKPLATLRGHTSWINSAVFSPDGGRILTASQDNTARLWDGGGKPLATLEGHTLPVSSAVFSRDGGRILTASEENTARLWDRDGTPLATIDSTDHVQSAVFSPDGGRILTASRDNTARLWDGDGKPLATLRATRAGSTARCFRPTAAAS